MIPKSQLISLSMIPGVEPRRIRSLLREYPEVEDILPEFDSYRTYKIKNIRDLKVIEYDFIKEIKK